MTMLLKACAIPLVRWAVTACGVVAVFGLWLWRHDVKVEARGAEKVIERSKEVGKVAHAKARKAHDAARAPGAAERLLADSCRDCR